MARSNTRGFLPQGGTPGIERHRNLEAVYRRGALEHSWLSSAGRDAPALRPARRPPPQGNEWCARSNPLPCFDLDAAHWLHSYSLMKHRNARVSPCLSGAIVALIFTFSLTLTGSGGALEDYLAGPDTNHVWKQVDQTKADGFTITQLEMTSQKWREHIWTHHLQIVRPNTVRNGHIAFLFITGDGDGRSSLPMLRILAERAGALAARLQPSQCRVNRARGNVTAGRVFDCAANCHAVRIVIEPDNCQQQDQFELT